MSFDVNRLIGYIPSIEDILLDLNITDPKDIAKTVLSKCEELYFLAEKNNKISLFQTSHEFILCNSSDFYKTFVDMGSGNSAMIISDDYSSDVYFLMFEDKIPSKFRVIAAAHESKEYNLIEKNIDQFFAHKEATIYEIKTASFLGLKKDYLSFVNKNYPAKFNEIKNLDLI